MRRGDQRRCGVWNETRAAKVAGRQRRQICNGKRFRVFGMVRIGPRRFDARDIGEISQTFCRFELLDELGESVAVFEQQRRCRLVQSGIDPRHAGEEFLADQPPDDRKALCQSCGQADMDVVAIDGETCGVGRSAGRGDAYRQGA